MTEITIHRATSADKLEWFKMRKGIWPQALDDYLCSDMDEILGSDKDAVFLAIVDERFAGMIEACLREYAEACETSPVGYIEGWFVYADLRGKGVAGALLQAAEDWAREHGCIEMASDTWLDNDAGIRAHVKLGYTEVERLVHFVKQL